MKTFLIIAISLILSGTPNLNIKPGSRFVPWDQLDFVFGSIILTLFFFPIELKYVFGGYYY